MMILIFLFITGIQTGEVICSGPVPVSSKVILGVSYPGWRGDFRNPEQHLQRIKDAGFQMVAFVPTYAYVGLNRIDLTSGPDSAELTGSIKSALLRGLIVVLKPHLDPLIYKPGFDPFTSDNHSWRVQAPWRGYFDVDPMSEDYRTGLVIHSLRMLQKVFAEMVREQKKFHPVRFELGAELMNSMVAYPGQWEKLLLIARKEIQHFGIRGRVLLSHNFSHHVEMPEDFILRMNHSQRRALARYIKGLDALAISQYMDLNAAVPETERNSRMPTPEEISQALLLHEKNFRRNILRGYLKLRENEIPPLHIGEFGIGRGGLQHPNLWAGDASEEQKQKIRYEAALGMQGLVAYLAKKKDRTAQSAVLWVTGGFYDIFGWMDPASFNHEAAEVIRETLR